MKINKKHSIDLNQYISVDTDRAWENVSVHIGNIFPRKKKRSIFEKTILAVAAVMTLSFLVWFTYDNVSQPIKMAGNYIIIKNDTKYDIDVPTIILENGENMELENNDREIKTIDYSSIKADVVIVGDTTKMIKNNTIVIPAKYTYKIILADGSEVMMNARSKLQYPTKFSRNERRVQLEGEAYFKIKKSEYPFVVSVNGADIKVYGTEFNVNVFRKNEVEVVLVNGSVGITASDSIETMMKPKQLYSLNCLSGISRLKEVNINNYISWRTEMFDFEQVSVREVLQSLSQWYDVEFAVQNEAILANLVDVYADRNGDIISILEALSKITDLHFVSESNGKFIIKSKQ